MPRGYPSPSIGRVGVGPLFDMKFIMIDAFKGASGKICSHSDMGATYNQRTGQTYSHKLCNKRNLDALPYSDKELSQQSAFKTRSAVVCATIKSLTDEQRKALMVLRNERKLYSFRQLIEDIYDKTTCTVPQTALANLIAMGKNSGNTTPITGGGGSGNGDEPGM